MSVLSNYMNMTPKEIVEKVQTEVNTIKNSIVLKEKEDYVELHKKLNDYQKSIQPLVFKVSDLKNEFYSFNNDIFSDWDFCLNAIKNIPMNAKMTIVDNFMKKFNN